MARCNGSNCQLQSSWNETPTTEDWFLNSKIFDRKEATNGFLWLYAKPRAGKTILHSTIIEHVKSWCAGESSNCYTYFYFHFSDAQKQTLSNMLDSIIAQLSVAYLWGHVDELSRRESSLNLSPSTDSLLSFGTCFFLGPPERSPGIISGLPRFEKTIYMSFMSFVSLSPFCGDLPTRVQMISVFATFLLLENSLKKMAWYKGTKCRLQEK